MASDAIRFYRIGRCALTAEMRRSARAWKKLVAEFGESVYHRSAAAGAVASGMQPKLSVGHHTRTCSIHDGVVKAAGVPRMNEEESMECRQLERSSCSPLGCHL